MPRPLSFVALATACVFTSDCVMASDSDVWPADRLLAGEIIMVPQHGANKTPSRAASATEQRDRAKSYQKDEAAGSAFIIVQPEEESEGALSPRVVAPPERARENRSRAYDYQHGTDSSFPQGLIKPDTGNLLEGGTTQDRAYDNRSRASAYSKGLNSHVSRVGPDGIPLVVCKDKDNVTGQIGDEELKSGSVIVIVRDGKQIKMRCQ